MVSERGAPPLLLSDDHFGVAGRIVAHRKFGNAEFVKILDRTGEIQVWVRKDLVGAAVFTDLLPFLKWSLAIIAGGAAAGMVQGATGLLRLKSTALTGGLAIITAFALTILFNFHFS